MRKYTDSSRIILASITVAIVVVSAVITAIVFLPGLTPTNPTTTTPTGPTTTEPTNGGKYGPLAADYLTSRRDDVHFLWIYNCSFVNERLSNYYKQTNSEAFVDGVKMIRNTTHAWAQVLFAPWDSNIEGFGDISLDDWSTLSGSLVDDGLRQMADATTPGEGFPSTWPVDFIIDIFFDDLTFFFIGFTSTDGLVYIQNGTWTGSYTEYGWPEIDEYFPGYWLEEGGYLQTPMDNLYNTITQAVSYPEL
jgi:hypothetical protein